MSEKHCFGQQRHELLSPYNKSGKGSQRNNILFLQVSHLVSCSTRKAVWVFWLKIPCPHAPFGVIVNLVMGLRGGPVVKTLHSQCRRPGFNLWSGSYIRSRVPHVMAHPPQKKKNLVTQCLFSVFSVLQSRPWYASCSTSQFCKEGKFDLALHLFMKVKSNLTCGLCLEVHGEAQKH